MDMKTKTRYLKDRWTFVYLPVSFLYYALMSNYTLTTFAWIMNRCADGVTEYVTVQHFLLYPSCIVGLCLIPFACVDCKYTVVEIGIKWIIVMLSGCGLWLSYY